MKKDEDFIIEIRKHSRILAASMKKILSTRYSAEFLETIYTPIVAEILFNCGQDNFFYDAKADKLFFETMEDFYDFYNPEMPINGGWSFEVEWEPGNYDFITSYPPNIYEKIIYKIFRISHLQLKYSEPKTIKIGTFNKLARKELKLLLDSEESFFPPNVVDLIPYSLFENLNKKYKTSNYPLTKVIWLDLYLNENYLFYLAYIKEKGAKVISQSHGASCKLTSVSFSNEVAEKVISDENNTPKWNKNEKAFPHLRVSRSLFINIKDIYRTLFNKKRNRLLVLIGYIYPGDEPSFMKTYLKSGLILDHVIKQITELSSHFPDDLDFKIHPKQDQYDHSLNGLTKLKTTLKKIYPKSEVITEGSARLLAHRYNGVISMDYYSSSLLEISATKNKQYVYIGPELAIHNDFESLLWDTRKSSSRSDMSKGAYIEINNKEIRKAYGASFFYPISFSLLIRKIIAQNRREQSISQ